MPITILIPEKVLRKLHKKQSISEENLSNFKKNLQTFLEKIKDPNRENKQETDLRDFLNDAFYKEKHYINKKENADWVIYNDAHGKGKVAVIIEVKSTSAKTEMITDTEPNVKALHELVRYYLHERLDNNNHEIKHLIATNCHEWYIFDELWFNQNIYTTVFKNTYKDWKRSGHNTDDFYKLHAKSHIENLENDIEFCKIDIREYAKTTDKKLKELYQMLSPEHLLKKEIDNDANKLNEPFYRELLYLLGIEERKASDSNKKIIDRIAENARQDGSLLENAINKLKVSDCLSRIPNLDAFGETEDEQLYSVALELCITWLNRILFLKLLEAQLVTYHGGDKNYKFLSYEKINDFDELSELFFEVLAKPMAERSQSVNQKFGNIPYLNSSLFEVSEVEKATFSIESLKDRLQIKYFDKTVLVENTGKQQKGEVKILKYLFAFLDAYNFGSDEEKEGENTSPKHDKLINSAVLGLIFEKLNGYKDGSFYTPAFITMYMCRETIRRAVVQKFNEKYTWNFTNFEELKDRIGNFTKKEDRKNYNELVNSIKICDPAVGSGHFLVSALNELISIKADLNILQHPDGKTLSGLKISIENDELIVFDENEGKDFEYRVGKNGNLIAEKQLIQETLFEEKRTIIENCLFGVDINPKSVKICQLRLWIELLKNAYYKSTLAWGSSTLAGLQAPASVSQLETLPNIDINIKCGNSLVSKYALNEDLSEVFRKQKFGLKLYQDAVAAYKEAKNKTAKAELQRFINEIKEQFKETVKNTDPRRKKLKELLGKRVLLDNNIDLFGNKNLADDQLELQKRKLEKQIDELESEITDISNSKIYRNSFEWRFEFPEVFDENGNFVGFDVVIGNPPYIALSRMKEYGKIFENNYATYSKSSDIYCLFYEKGIQLLKNQGFVTYITSNSWLKTQYGESLRIFFESKTNPKILINIEDAQVFEEATVESNILMLQQGEFIGNLEAVSLKKDFNKNASIEKYFTDNKLIINELDKKGWNIGNQMESDLKRKIETGSKFLKDWEIVINYGIKTGLNDAYIIDEQTKNKIITEDPKSHEIIKPVLRGKSLKKYFYNYDNEWLINVHNGIKSKNINAVDVHSTYPAILKHLLRFENELKKRSDKGNDWTNLRNCAYIEDFEKVKIIWGEISNTAKFIFDEEGFYTNDKCFIMTGKNLKYLLAILNSKVSEWYFNQISVTSGMGTNLWKKYKIEQLPIKDISPDLQQPFIEKVDKILAFNAGRVLNPASVLPDSVLLVKQIEAELDEMVFELYELTAEERAIVKGN